jgi:hypothetical protein
MHKLIEEVLDALRGLGWNAEIAEEPSPLPAGVTKRHPDLPPLAIEFFTHVRCCVDPDERGWFLAAEDFASRDGLRWDQYERMLLENADAEQADEVRAFWDRYLPIYYLPEDDYQYFALGTDRSSKHFGKVVWAAEAIHDEEPLVVSDSYEEFLVQLRDVARHPTPDADATIARLIRPDFEGAAPETVWTRIKRWFR